MKTFRFKLYQTERNKNKLQKHLVKLKKLISLDIDSQAVQDMTDKFSNHAKRQKAILTCRIVRRRIGDLAFSEFVNIKKMVGTSCSRPCKTSILKQRLMITSSPKRGEYVK